jgi:hypothetical protein
MSSDGYAKSRGEYDLGTWSCSRIPKFHLLILCAVLGHICKSFRI